MNDNNNKALISVIIPIYNVEQYLPKCIESVLLQTYSNLEIILVDDGSPDACPQICDEYAKIDSRIKVVHKQNGGLSDARDAGLDIATGSYISFVDSDDWVEKDMIAIMYKAIQDFNVQIAICSYARNSDKQTDCYITHRPKLFSWYEALEYLLQGELENFAWNKLYARGLFDSIRFPVGKNYEDIAIMYRIIEKADNIVLLPDILYHYVYRKDGIVSHRALGDCIDRVAIEIERYHYIKEKYPEFCEKTLLTLFHAYRPLMVANLKASGQERKQYMQQRRICDIFLKDNLTSFMNGQPIYKKIEFRLAVRGKVICDFAALCVEMLHRLLQ